MSTAVQRLQQALEAIAAAGVQGQHTFTQLYPEAAREAAEAADARAARGLSLGPLDGAIVSIKDLLDVAGQVTTAGSAVLRDQPPALQDAPVVQRLRAAGAVLIGKTNMTEFAFSGIGINPHYGTPGNARDVSRIPGGSSSGAGVAVAQGLCEISIGSDTGGSIRIPSALNGLVGFKPSQSRVPRSGAFPLSFSLDTIGPLARSVQACADTDAVLSGSAASPLTRRSAAGLRIGVPRGLLFTQTEPPVLEAFEAALAQLRAAGARVGGIDLEALIQAPLTLQERGTLVAAEAAHIHRQHLETRRAEIDPQVIARIERGAQLDAASYVGIQQARPRLQAEMDAALADLDLLVLPTVPFVAPAIAALADPQAFQQANHLILRNPSIFNFYDLPALSLPLPVRGLPIGLMLVGRRQADRELLAIGAAIEALLKA